MLSSMRPIVHRLPTSVVLYRRAYTVIPSTPQQAVVTPTTVEQHKDHVNSLHALYNNENQSVHETYLNTPGQTYHSLSGDHHATFSPSFNSVFDE